jgi:hypothetical protein
MKHGESDLNTETVHDMLSQEVFNKLANATLALACVTLVLVIKFRDRYVFSSKRDDLPGPKGFPLVGNLFQILPWKDRPLEWLIYMTGRYGAICTLTLPPWGRALVINHPQWLAHIKTSMVFEHLSTAQILNVVNDR